MSKPNHTRLSLGFTEAGEQDRIEIYGPNREYNARLIKAAPSLLAALEALVRPKRGVSRLTLEQRKIVDDLIAKVSAVPNE